MAFYKQSTAYTRAFKMIDSSDHFSKKTGLTCTVNVSKAGGSFAAAGGTVTEVANGWYKVALTTTDTNTLGDLAFYITATGADDTDFVDQVVVRDLADLAYPATSGRSMVVDASGLVDANAVKVGPTGSGTAQTARDIGASVLLSTGTGTGQLDFTSGVVKANATQWLGGTIPAVNVTGVPLVDAKYLLGTIFATPATAGILDANVKNMNNVAATAITTIKAVQGLTTADTIATYTGNTKQTADVSTLITTVGTPAGASIAADIAEIEGETDTLVTGVNVTSLAGQTVTAAAGVTFPSSVASPTNITAGTITSLTNAPTSGDFTAAMKASITTAATAATPTVTAGTVTDKTGYALTSSYDFAKGSVSMTESYAAQGATMTPVQALYQAVQVLGQNSVSGTTMTVKKRDGSTTAKTFTLNDATTPTAITEAT